ncbi:hypothetical protein SAMN05880557_11941 [Pseudacidovorax sp. RU35E]|nr:hypothetical protein SAMN05880557_11941 [Pseudacidovorax sp. RU35E]
MTDAYRQRLQLASLLVGVLMAGGTGASEKSTPVSTKASASVAGTLPSQQTTQRIWITVGQRRFAITVADTAAGKAFAARLPMRLEMAELNGNEKHVDLAAPLPADASRPGTIRSGDLMLYGTKTIVLFYETFDSPYSYTRLGRVDDPVGLDRALGRRDVHVEFSDE